MDEWIKKDVVCRHNGIVFHHKRREYPAICKSMNEPWAHYVKSDKSDGKTHVLYITYMCNIKQANLCVGGNNNKMAVTEDRKEKKMDVV